MFAKRYVFPRYDVILDTWIVLPVAMPSSGKGRCVQLTDKVVWIVSVDNIKAFDMEIEDFVDSIPTPPDHNVGR